jgi:hypothetical protein
LQAHHNTKKHLRVARFASRLERRSKQWVVSSVLGDDTATKPIDLSGTGVLAVFNVLEVGAHDHDPRQPRGYGWLAWLIQMFDWTNGCIAVTDEEMAEIWEMVPDGVPIEIRP